MSQPDGISSPLFAMTLGNIFYFIIYGVLQVFKQSLISLRKTPLERLRAFQLLPSLSGDFFLVSCLLPRHLRNQLVSGYPKTNGVPLASVPLPPRVEVWTEKA